MSAASALTIRSATAHDDAALRRLAALDSKPAIARPAIIAEVGGEAVAALALRDGAVAADPFEPTLAIIEHLRLHADALREAAPRRSVRRRILGTLHPVPRPGMPATA